MNIHVAFSTNFCKDSNSYPSKLKPVQCQLFCCLSEKKKTKQNSMLAFTAE